MALLCYRGHFGWHELGPLVLLERRVTAVTAKQYKVVLSDHVYPTMNNFYPGGCIVVLFEDDSASIGLRGSLNENDSQSPELNPIEHLSKICYTALSTTIMKTPKKGMSFGRIMFSPSIKILLESVPRQCGSAWWLNTLLFL